jgi:glycosyltransferase involved in cell wall biosynthesis
MKSLSKAHTPFFSIVMSSYNYEKYIECAIDSVISQSFGDWELIIVDDCSKDSSKKIIENYANKDNRIKYIFHEKNLGIAQTFTDGMKAAIGNYYILCSSDDMFPEGAFEKIANIFGETKTKVIIFEAHIIDEQDEKTGVLFSQMNGKPAILKGNFFEELCKSNFIVTGAVERALIERHNVYFDKAFAFLNDWFFWLELAHFTDFLFIEEPLYCYRVHGKSVTSLDPKHGDEDILLRDIVFEKYGAFLKIPEKFALLNTNGLRLAGLGKFKEARQCYLKARHYAPISVQGIRFLIRTLLTFAPPLYRRFFKVSDLIFKGPSEKASISRGEILSIDKDK